MSDNCSDYGCCDNPSDTTKERPGEVGMDLPDAFGAWFDGTGKPWLIAVFKPLNGCEPTRGGYELHPEGWGTEFKFEQQLPPGGWSKAVPESELATLKARLAEVEAERNAAKSQAIAYGCEAGQYYDDKQNLRKRAEAAEAERDKYKRIDDCNQGTIELAIRRAEAAEQRVKEIQAAWNRVAGFAVSESCGPENRFRITIDYPTLEKLQDAYRAMHDITTAIATTPPADGAQSS